MLLIQVGLLEDLPLKYRSQKLPKLDFEKLLGDDEGMDNEDESISDDDNEEDDDDDDDEQAIATQPEGAMRSIMEDEPDDADWDEMDSDDDDDEGTEGKSNDKVSTKIDDDDLSDDPDVDVKQTDDGSSKDKNKDKDKSNLLKGTFKESSSWLVRPHKHESVECRYFFSSRVYSHW